MFFNILALAPLLTLASAYGRAIVNNQCDTPVYLWSVGSTIGPKVVVRKDTSYSEIFHRDPRSGGIAIKLTAVDDGLYKPNVSQTIFAYNLDAAKNQIWCDLSDVFGDGFFGRRVNAKPSYANCASINWYSGAPVRGAL